MIDTPTGGPDRWIEEWFKIIDDCEQLDPEDADFEWTYTFINAWAGHPDLSFLVADVESMLRKKTPETSKEKLANELRKTWNYFRPVQAKNGGGRTARSIFNVDGSATYDGNGSGRS